MTSPPSAVVPLRLADSARGATVAAALVALFVVSMHLRRGAELADDGAFFLRYAENILQGEFWVWNRGEPPVWGASAPIYPFVIALPMALGIAPVTAVVWTGIGLMATALTITSMVLGSQFGWVAAATFAAFAALDTGLMYFGSAGMESPLTVLLLSLGVWALFRNARQAAAGLIAGLLLVHKLDLVPAGVLLLAAIWLRDRRCPRTASAICGAIAASWYLFAWIRFGAPLPNSFLTKSLHQEFLSQAIDWRWFGHYVLAAGFHPWLVAIALTACAAGRRVRPAALLLFGIVAVHVAAYTWKAPFEAYNWYAVPSVYALCALAAIGIGSLEQRLRVAVPRLAATVLALTIVAAIVAFSLTNERRNTADVKTFASYQESDRADAGRWVHDHAPSEFRVYTMWGGPAYYSHRYVFDGSFLNRAFEPVRLVDKYRPEILILQGDPGVLPAEPVFPAAGGAYEVVKVFAKSHAAGMDYFFAVLARHDVVGRIRGRETTINLARYVRDAQPGDRFGTIKPQGLGLFVHPGASTPSRFEIDVAAYARETAKTALLIEARFAPNVPIDAVRRGAANVRVVVSLDGHVVAETVVTAESAQTVTLDATVPGNYRVTVENNGDADTDWLILRVR